MDQYAPVQPRLRNLHDPLLEARHPLTLLLVDIFFPSSGVWEIPQTMLDKFREARVADCVRNWARWDLAQENASVPRGSEGRGSGKFYCFPTHGRKIPA
jgi:hypothetical protein